MRIKRRSFIAGGVAASVAQPVVMFGWRLRAHLGRRPYVAVAQDRAVPALAAWGKQDKSKPGIWYHLEAESR